MKHITKSSLFILLSFYIFIACGKIPETHYYTLSYPSVENRTTSPKLDKIIAVKKFLADPPYDQDRIVYRESLYEVKFYNYRRWICSPREMLTESAVQHLRKSGLFAGVVHAQSGHSSHYVLTGRILQFEEWDEGVNWQAKIKLWLDRN